MPLTGTSAFPSLTNTLTSLIPSMNLNISTDYYFNGSVKLFLRDNNFLLALTEGKPMKKPTPRISVLLDEGNSFYTGVELVVLIT